MVPAREKEKMGAARTLAESKRGRTTRPLGKKKNKGDDSVLWGKATVG